MDKFEIAEQKGRDKFESLLQQKGIQQYQFSKDRMDRVDCRFTTAFGKRWIVEIKVRDKLWNPLFMELSKFDAMKQMLSDGDADAGMYVNFIGDQCYIFNLNQITQQNGCYLQNVYCNKTTAEDNGQEWKQMINLPLDLAKKYHYQEGQWG